MPGFNLGNHGLEAGTVEVCSTVSIVRKMLDIVKAVFASVIFQILFLIQNAVRFTLQFIISGKPFVQCRDFSLVGFCHSFTFFVFLVGGTICNKDTILFRFCKRIFALS